MGITSHLMDVIIVNFNVRKNVLTVFQEFVIHAKLDSLQQQIRGAKVYVEMVY